MFHSPGRIPFGRMMKFKFLARFPFDHLPQQVMSSPVLFVCSFAVFTYDLINCFVSITIKAILAILLHLIKFCLNIFGPCFALLLEEIQFLPSSVPFLVMSRSSALRFHQFFARNIHKVVFFLPISVFLVTVILVIIRLLFYTHIPCQCHFLDVRPPTSLLSFLSSDPF